MKELCKELQVDFFNRLKVWIEIENGQHQLVSFKELTNHLSAKTYDVLIDRLGELEHEFKISVADYLNKKQLV